MNEHLFGGGKGHLSATAARAAKSAGATLVNHHDAGCACGHGCRRNCPANARHWFAAPNRGAPHDGATERAVMDAVRGAATKADRKVLGL